MKDGGGGGEINGHGGGRVGKCQNKAFVILKFDIQVISV